MTAAVLLLAAALSAGNAELDESARMGAYEIAVSRAKAEAAKRGAPAGELAKAMLGAPAEYAQADASREKAKDLYLSLVDDALRAEDARIRERLGLRDSACASQSAALDGRQRDAVLALFDSRYAEERRAACEEQAKTIVSATRPTESEMESRSDDELRAMMVARIVEKQKSPVFEENVKYISRQMVEPVIEDAKKEMRRQAEYLSRAHAVQVAPSKMCAELADLLKANVAARAASCDPSVAWGVFPSVLSKSLGEAVERRTVGRLVAQVEGESLDVRVEDVADAIAKDPASHVRRQESERRFAQLYSSQLVASAYAKVIAEAPEADRDELKEYLGGRLQCDAVSKSVSRLVRRDVMPKWKTARQEAAMRLARSVWPTLVDGTWCPDPELGDSISARSDYASAVRGWRREKGMEPLAEAPGGAPVMEEADEAADAAVARAFDIARSAIAAQNKILDDSHAGILAESRARKESFWRRTPDFKAVVGMLTEAVETAWGRTRLDTLWPDADGRPSNADEQHRELFPSVREKIELLAKVIVEEMNEPQPEETPEETVQEDEMEFTLSVVRRNAEIELKLERGGEVLDSATVPAEGAKFDRAMDGLSRKLGRDVLKLPY